MLNEGVEAAYMVNPVSLACHELFQLVDSELGIATAVAPVYRSSACIWRHRLEAGVPFFRFPKRVEYAPESNIPIT